MDERERLLREADRAARSAHRWATVSMWGSGCALALYGLAALLMLAVVAIVAWVFIAG
jgi:hypothetical protein